MKRIISKFLHINYALIILLLTFATEAYFKVIFFSTKETQDILQVTKGIILVCLGIFILLKHSKSLFSLLMLLVSFFIGQIALSNSISQEASINFLKLIFPIILLMFFNNYTLSTRQKEKLFVFFEYIILFNSLLIVVGFLLNMNVLNSYLGPRFGYNGLFITSSTSSYVYGITLIYLIIKYKKKLFNRLPNVLIILSMLFIGTKVSYIFLISFLTVYLWKYTVLNKKKIIGVVIALVLIAFYVFFFKYGIFNEVRQNDGLLSSLMSYRNELLIDNTLPFIQNNWSFLNYLFGGVSEMATKSQIEFVDIFYFFGIFGGALYIYIFFKSFIVVKVDLFLTVLLLIFFIVVFLAGNFFSYPSIAIYLVILREYLKLDE